MTIKEIRTACGMTQQEFADKLKIPKRAIENWEGGQRVPPEYVVQLIEYRMAEHLKK
jgi:DNA-binding transcriptional regulator YiaG